MPGDLVRAIRWHHEPGRAFEATDPKPLHQAVYLVQLANQLAKYCYVYGDRTEIDAVDDAAFDTLGLPKDLTALLDDRVRAAATKAILCAHDASARPATGVRRFLRLNRGAAMTAMLEQTRNAGPRRSGGVAIDDAVTTAAMTIGNDEKAKRFSAQATETGLSQMIRDIDSACGAESPDHPDAAMAFAAQCLLANVLGYGGRAEAVVSRTATGRRVIAVRADAIAFANRFGQTPEPELAAAVLDAEMANVLNLGWCESIVTSTDGSTLVLTSKA